MKVEVIEEQCIACGMCVYEESANGAFVFNEEGKAKAVKDEVTPAIENLVDVCPTGAIVINEEAA